MDCKIKVSSGTQGALQSQGLVKAVGIIINKFGVVRQLEANCFLLSPTYVAVYGLCPDS